MRNPVLITWIRRWQTRFFLLGNWDMWPRGWAWMITNSKVISTFEKSIKDGCWHSFCTSSLWNAAKDSHVRVLSSTYIYIYTPCPGEVLNTPVLCWLCWNWFGLMWNIPPVVKQRQQQDAHPPKESQRWSTCIYALRMVDVSGCRKETDGLILSRSWGGLTMFNSKTGLAISY